MATNALARPGTHERLPTHEAGARLGPMRAKRFRFLRIGRRHASCPWSSGRQGKGRPGPTQFGPILHRLVSSLSRRSAIRRSHRAVRLRLQQILDLADVSGTEGAIPVNRPPFERVDNRSRVVVGEQPSPGPRHVTFERFSAAVPGAHPAKIRNQLGAHHLPEGHRSLCFLCHEFDHPEVFQCPDALPYPSKQIARNRRRNL